MLITLALGLALADERPYEADERQYGIWLQQACRIQQTDRNPAQAPASYEAFCQCFSDDMREAVSPEGFRLMALGSQASIEGRGEIQDWEVVRDRVMSEFEALPEEEQLAIPQLMQEALQACIMLTPPTTE
ncbi:hypothetical protein ACFELO_10235 [Oceanicaulis sp. LC35]|uniref:hypothetical protein n=1 Tax=Oceanicaulis sp. LC35 TaxID=3349635 RepID=UPI003F8473A3